MDARQAEVLKSIDPGALGLRIRAARVARGMTQTDLAGDELSVGYVSRIESGQRRPTGKVFQHLAVRLGTSLDELLLGVAPREYDEIRLTLDYAELALESGQPEEAAMRSHEALERSSGAALEELAERARYLHARALEALGDLDQAIIELEGVATRSTSTMLRIRGSIALSRAYRESGDFAAAIETGERMLAELDETPLAETDESVQLAVTVAAAYYERGDTGQAVRVCRRAVEKAEQLGTPTARAAAYWNASVMESRGGSAQTAVTLAERALTLLGEGQDARNLARLRTQLGTMQLRLDPPEVDEARQQLEKAAEELAWSSAAPDDIASNDLALARSLLLRGDPETALELSNRAYDAIVEVSPLVAAEAKAVEGLAHAGRGSSDEALSAYQQAVHILTGVGADRAAAQLWFELADLLEQLGEYDASRLAYRSAAASAGVRSRSTATTAAVVAAPAHPVS